MSLRALPLAAVLAACGSGDGERPSWIDLAHRFQPRPLLEVTRGWIADEERDAVRIRPHDEFGQVWIETTLAADDWTPGDAPGTWSADRPRTGAFARYPDGRLRLAAGERELRRVRAPLVPGDGEYDVRGDRILLTLAPGEPSPGPVTYGVRIGNGGAVDDTWRLLKSDRVGTGIPVWSGEREELVCDIPPHSSLRVVTSWDAGLSTQLADDRPGRVRILLDGAPVLDAAQGAKDVAHVVPLPAGGGRGATFTFQAEGAPGLALFFQPQVGPADVGTYVERPWGRSRPNIVLFIADTLRADCLAAYGGRSELAPNLDAFARRSLRCLNARSTSSWTLPAISSLLTGIFPGEHGATDEHLPLSYDLTTIPEVLREHGYRTGAITDAAFFTQAFGLDQGFDWFTQTAFPGWDLDETVSSALEFLDRDDGRPVFLVVHSYRTHAPYRTGSDEDLSRWNELMRRGFEMIEQDSRSPDEAEDAAFRAFNDEFRELYEEGVRDLDRGFGELLAEVERRGVLDNGYLFFTSDHGEAFGEHGDVQHGNDLWDVKVRVPLLVTGHDVTPGDLLRNVSLVDFPRTIAELAGVSDAGDWSGISILDRAAGDAPSYSFLIQSTHRQVTIVDQGRKVFARPDPDLLADGVFERAFDLTADPNEEHDLAESAPWAEGMCVRHADRVRALLEARATPDPLDLAGAARPDLAAIGYDGGERQDGE